MQGQGRRHALRFAPVGASVIDMKLSVRLGAALGTAVLLTSCGSPAPSREEELLLTVAADNRAVPMDASPLNSEGLLAGTAHPTLAEGEEGEISVVDVGRLEKTGYGAHLPIVFRNNTDETVSHLHWDAAAHDDGTLVATGDARTTTPARVPPGEIGFSTIEFDDEDAIPHSAEYTFAAKVSPSHAAMLDAGLVAPEDADTAPHNPSPLTITEAYLADDDLVGVATNTTGADTRGPYFVNVYCFDGDSLISEFTGLAEEAGGLADGEAVTFTADFFRQECPTFLFGVSGWF